MDAAFWLEKWSQGQIGFHAAKPNALLVEHVGELLAAPTATEGATRSTGAQGAIGLPASRVRRVYVPLCGKSLDLHFLRGAGFDEVVGTELSPLATEAFFAEAGLKPEVRMHDGWREFVAPGIRIIEGDIFTLPPGAIPPCDAAYDRAALVAMDPARRPAYINHLKSVLRPGSPILLIAFNYDTSRMSGPPFSVDAAVVHECFPPPASPRLLGTRELINSEPRFRDRGLSSIREECWVLEHN